MENKIIEILEKSMPNKIQSVEDKGQEIYVEKTDLVEAVTLLKGQGFDFLADITAVDYTEYYEVVYQLNSFKDDRYLMVKVKLEHENPQLESLFGLWKTADWLEREVYDLMGIKFNNHPNLERILTWEGFEGHPLQKSYISKGGRR